MGACMSKKGVDASPQKRPISKSTSALTAKSPGKVRVQSKEFTGLATRMRTLKAACLAQMEHATRYETNYKAIYGHVNTFSTDMASKHYPDSDEFKEFADSVAETGRGLDGAFASATSTEQPFKKMQDEYRKFLAEITAIEGQFKNIEKEEKALTSENKRLSKLENAKAKDEAKIEASKSAVLIHRNTLEADEAQLIERMRAVEKKAKPVFHAGHVAMYLGLAELTDAIAKPTQTVVDKANAVAPAFVALDGEPRIVEVATPSSPYKTADEGEDEVPAAPAPVLAAPAPVSAAPSAPVMQPSAPTPEPVVIEAPAAPTTAPPPPVPALQPETPTPTPARVPA